jgi:hypothetical protein
MPYSDDMSQEKKPAGLIPEGERVLRITEMIEGKSKNGNNMFTVTVEDIKTHKSMPIWLISEPKKRWMLKSLLSAVGVAGGQDGVYNWDIKDVIGKTVIGVVEHFQEPWINREGKEVTSTKAKITDFLTYTPPSEPEIAWKD